MVLGHLAQLVSKTNEGPLESPTALSWDAEGRVERVNGRGGRGGGKYGEGNRGVLRERSRPGQREQVNLGLERHRTGCIPGAAASGGGFRPRAPTGEGLGPKPKAAASRAACGGRGFLGPLAPW